MIAKAAVRNPVPGNEKYSNLGFFCACFCAEAGRNGSVKL